MEIYDCELKTNIKMFCVEAALKITPVSATVDSLIEKAKRIYDFVVNE